MRVRLLLVLLTMILFPALAFADAGTVSASCTIVYWGAGETRDVVKASFTWDVPSLIVAKTEKLYLRSGYRDLIWGWRWTTTLIHCSADVAPGSGETAPVYVVDWFPYRGAWNDQEQYCVQVEVTTVLGKKYVGTSAWTALSPYGR